MQQPAAAAGERCRPTRRRRWQRGHPCRPGCHSGARPAHWCGQFKIQHAWHGVRRLAWQCSRLLRSAAPRRWPPTAAMAFSCSLCCASLLASSGHGPHQLLCLAAQHKSLATAADVLLEKKNPQDLAQAVAGEGRWMGVDVQRLRHGPCPAACLLHGMVCWPFPTPPMLCFVSPTLCRREHHELRPALLAAAGHAVRCRHRR